MKRRQRLAALAVVASVMADDDDADSTSPAIETSIDPDDPIHLPSNTISSSSGTLHSHSHSTSHASAHTSHTRKPIVVGGSTTVSFPHFHPPTDTTLPSSSQQQGRSDGASLAGSILGGVVGGIIGLLALLGLIRCLSSWRAHPAAVIPGIDASEVRSYAWFLSGRRRDSSLASFGEDPPPPYLHAPAYDRLVRSTSRHSSHPSDASSVVSDPP